MTSNIVTQAEFDLCNAARSALSIMDAGVIPATLDGKDRVLVLSVPSLTEEDVEHPVAIVLTEELVARLEPAEGQVVLEGDEDEATSEGSEDVA